MMSNTNLEVRVSGIESASQEEAVINLYEELAALPGLRIATIPETSAPAGSKGIDLGIAGLLVSLGASGALLPTVIQTIGEWLARRRHPPTIRFRDGDLELEWSGSEAPEKIIRLIAAHLEK
jgi:hypothetical protein